MGRQLSVVHSVLDLSIDCGGSCTCFPSLDKVNLKEIFWDSLLEDENENHCTLVVFI